MNVWGMPENLGSKYKQDRMKAIAQEISKGDYDLYLLDELWMQPDHTTIANSIPAGYQITGFRELASGMCDGRVLITCMKMIINKVFFATSQGFKCI